MLRHIFLDNRENKPSFPQRALTVKRIFLKIFGTLIQLLRSVVIIHIFIGFNSDIVIDRLFTLLVPYHIAPSLHSKRNRCHNNNNRVYYSKPGGPIIRHLYFPPSSPYEIRTVTPSARKRRVACLTFSRLM